MTSERSVSEMSLLDPFQEMTQPEHSQPFLPTFFTTLSVITGAEVLSIANSMCFTGFTVSMFLMFFTTTLSYFCTIVILNLSERVQAESVNELATKIIGRWFGNTCSILGLCFTYCCLTSYIFIGSETVIQWLSLTGIKGLDTGYKRKLVVLVYSLLVPIPTTLPRKMNILGLISGLALAVQLAYFASVVYESFRYLPQGIDPTVETYKIDLGLFNAFAIYSLLFSLPAVILPIIRPYSPIMKKRYHLIGLAVFVSYIIVAIPGAIVYLIFGVKTEQISILSFDHNDFIMQIVKIGFFLVVNASYAAISVNVVQDVSSLIYHIDTPGTLPGLKRMIVLLITNIPPVLVSMLLPEIRPIFEVGGAFGGCMANFFIPPVLEFFSYENKKTLWCCLMAFVAIFGLVSCGIATYQAVLDALNPGD